MRRLDAIQRLGHGRLLPLAVGLGVLAAGTAAGWDGRIVAAIATPPALIRAALVAASVVVGIALLGRAIARLGAVDPPGADQRDLVALTRGVRLAFLAVAAFAAAGGWAIGHPLPIVVGLVIAGVDVLETSFLLLVIATKQAPASGDAADRRPPVSGA
jgi:hypothetical protein